MGSDRIVISEEEIRAISREIFGTSDYKSMYQILHPSDGMVNSFERELERLKSRKLAMKRRDNNG